MAKQAGNGSKQHELTVYRDTVESIWVAIVLAFVLRAFVIEAFVIPTGSMAPRLLGAHWDLRCPVCGYEYAYGGAKQQQDVGLLPRSKKTPPKLARCPNCGASYPYADRRQYVNSGDRVLVLKYLYRFAEPQPWDVVVFKNPQDNSMNYIKRLIGVPGDSIEIVHGDIFVSRDQGKTFDIRRKPPRAQRAMWQVVYDNDYRPDPNLLGSLRPPGWIGGRGAAHWDMEGWAGRRFAFEGSDLESELVFQPGPGGFLPHYGYNEWGEERKRYMSDTDVCGDLKLSVVMVPRDRPSVLALRLSSFEFSFRAEVHTDGRAVLSCQSPDLPEGGFVTEARIEPLTIGRGCEIALTHVDFRASLWIDGRCVLQTTDQEYPGGRAHEWLARRLAETSRRPVPAPDLRISARGGPLDLWHTKVHRDVYYTQHRLDGVPSGPQGEYADEINKALVNRTLDDGDGRFRLVEKGGRGWGTAGCPIHLRKHPHNPDFDEFFVLGDNSPQSLDGRGWVAAAPSLRLKGTDGGFQYQLGTVPRYNLLGKALFVYWPGGHRTALLPGLPIIPNVGRMRFIR